VGDAAAAALGRELAPGGDGCAGEHECRTVRAKNVLIDEASIAVTHTESIHRKAPRPIRRRQPDSQFVTTTTTQLADLMALFPTLTPHPAVVPLVREGKAIVEAAGSQVLYCVPAGGAVLSSRAVREGPNSMGKFLADCVRASLQCEAVLLPSGKVRGNRDYPDGLVKFIDVMSELPFPDNQVCLIEATGRELESVLQYMWAHHVGRGGFLQTDSQLIYDPVHSKLVSVAGRDAAVDLDRKYSVAVPLTQLKGMDDNPALVAIGVRNNVKAIMVDDLLLLQQVVISHLSKQADAASAGAASAPEGSDDGTSAAL